MGSGLSYNEKLDWGDRPLPAKYIKAYGMLVFLLIGAYVWKFHQHHTSIFDQAALAARMIAVALLVAIRWTKPEKLADSLEWKISAQCVAQAISLFRPW